MEATNGEPDHARRCWSAKREYAERSVLHQRQTTAPCEVIT